MANYLPIIMSTTTPSVPKAGGFLPDTFMEQVEEFLEDTESDEDPDDDDAEEEETFKSGTQQQKEENSKQGLCHDGNDKEDKVSSSSGHAPSPQVSPTLVTQLSSVDAAALSKKVQSQDMNRIQVPFQQEKQKESFVDDDKKKRHSYPSPPRKSALKKVSSYNGLEGLPGACAVTEEETIPINTHKSAWKTLPAPKATTITSRVRRVGSSPALFPEPEQDEAPLPAPLSPSLSSPKPHQHRIKRNVSFTQIHVRDYPMTLGDNPSCVMGTPVTLDWDYQQQAPLAVEEYEAHRPARRNRYEMRLHEQARQDILRAAGVSRTDMKVQQEQISRTRRQRAATITLLPLEPLEALVESARRKVKRLSGLRKNNNSKKKNGTTTTTTTAMLNMKRSRSANALWEDASQ